MCFSHDLKNKLITSLNSFWLVSAMDTERAFCEEGTEFGNIISLNAETSTAKWKGISRCAAATVVVHSTVSIPIQTQDRVPYSRQCQLSLCSCKQVC
jgi:hypothetical protein